MKRRFFAWLWGFGVLFLVSLPVTGFAQDQELLNRINRLENELQTLNQATFRDGVNAVQRAPAAQATLPPPTNGRVGQSIGSIIQEQQGGVGGIKHIGASAGPNTELRLNALERQLQLATGQFEQANFKLDQLRGQLESFIADTNLRLQNIEASAANISEAPVVQRQQDRTIQVTNPKPSTLKTNALAAPSSNIDIKSTSLEVKPEAEIVEINEPNSSASNTLGQLSSLGTKDIIVKSYDDAFSLLRQGEYDAAGNAFQLFLDQYESHNLAPNAQYWLSETYYARGEYERAAKGFAGGYQAYPDGGKAADNLLKLSLSLANLDRKDEACATLGQLEVQAKKAPAAVLRRAEQERETLGCP